MFKPYSASADFELINAVDMPVKDNNFFIAPPTIPFE
jgi:hypothetical protein